jgi:uncharacterized phage protein gp47/JayE
VTDVPATGYITYPLDQDTSSLAQAAYDYIQSQIPGWQPSPGNLDVLIIEAFAQQAAELAEITATVPESIFRYFGASLLGFQPQDAVSASAFATWVMADNAGYTIPAGTVVDVEGVAFANVNAFTIANGSTTQTLVEMAAVEPGVDGNSLTGAAELVDPLAFISSVTFTTTSSGGVDAETDEDYLNRLSALLQTLAPRPIIPRDFALLAQQIEGVERAVAIDLLDPITPDTSAERSVTVAAVDADGQPVSPTMKGEIEDALEGAREVNFNVYVIDPELSPVDVSVDFTIVEGYDPTDVEDAVEDALNTYLSPATWGLPAEGGEATGWTNTTTVRFYEVAAVVNSVPGVDYIDYLEIDGNPYGSEIVLSGYAPLPEPGTIVATAI